jgi:hypothetical protein
MSLGTIPSGSGGSTEFADCSANGAPPHEKQEVKQYPPDEKQANGNRREDQRPDRAALQGLGGVRRMCRTGADRRGNVFLVCDRRLM